MCPPPDHPTRERRRKHHPRAHRGARARAQHDIETRHDERRHPTNNRPRPKRQQRGLEPRAHDDEMAARHSHEMRKAHGGERVFGALALELGAICRYYPGHESPRLAALGAYRLRRTRANARKQPDNALRRLTAHDAHGPHAPG